jgi:adenylate kinase
LISSISNGIGTGLLESVDYPDPEHLIKHHPKKTPLHLMDSDWRIPLMLNLKIKPSLLFVGGGTGEEDAAEPDFNWHCKDGLAVNIQKVKEEFCKKRGLKPVKILITGPPGSGKSFYGKQLAEHYNVPHIHLKHMLQEIETWNKEKEDGITQRREVKARIRAQEEAIKEEERKRAAASSTLTEKSTKSKKSKAAPEQPPPEEPPAQQPPAEEEKKKPEEKPETDSDDEYKDIDIKRRIKEFKAAHPGERFTVDLINEAVRWRLNQNDCQNRGYVLDGYPRSFAESNGVFFVTNPKPEPKFIIDEATGEKVAAPDEMDEEALKEYLKPKFQKNIYPDSVIVLRGGKDMILNRLKKFVAELPEDQQKEHHWTPADQERRFSSWFEHNAIANYAS